MGKQSTNLSLVLNDAITRTPGSVRALAREAGVPHTSLVRVRSGAIDASPALVARVAAALERWGELCKRHSFRLEQEVYRSARTEPATYMPLRGGHAPRELREALTAWLRTGPVVTPAGRWSFGGVPLVDDGPVPAEWLLGQLWNCTDVLPTQACEALGIPAGSTYARAAREVKKRAFRP